MSYSLYAHPFSSYCWKALIALYEKEIAFDYRMIETPGVMDELRGFWPLGKFPLLIDAREGEAAPIVESTTIIEYLDLRHYDRAPLIPANPLAAIDVRFMDRVFDNHVMTPMNAVVAEYLIDRDNPDAARIAKAKAALETIYGWLETRLAGQDWACGAEFTLADIAAAPSLFYADWVQPIGARWLALAAYRARLLARPSVARCVEEARPYRGYFPPGAPDRD